ncbi:MAG TPA: TetR/AcrR family transcriptional regulator [Kineosporiaceae bacterium]|nr:TetR/AcrR family transcriptional regulator [Kineosporiaceae bacterium]
MAEESVARTVRRQARDELTRRIVETARTQLAMVGASGLSLRAVARELGMVSSAVYRYVPSRDELLTLLIIEAYDALGAAAERAESRVAREDVAGRFRAVCLGVRRWAIRHPHEYALIYGSPVPGYAAPEATIGPASRVGALLVGIMADGVRHGKRSAGRVAAGLGEDGSALPEPVRRAIAPIRAFTPPQVPDELVVAGLMAWTYLFGAVNFELFGHRHNVVADPAALREAFFEHEISRMAALTGITG